MKVQILFPHKVKNGAIRELVEQYVAYARRYAAVETAVTALSGGDGRLTASIGERLRNSVGVVLSERGESVTSLWFAQRIRECRMQSQDLTFVIGGASGYPDELNELCRHRIALTPLTLPHEMALLILTEQIWRAVSMEAGHPYHK